MKKVHTMQAAYQCVSSTPQCNKIKAFASIRGLVWLWCRTNSRLSLKEYTASLTLLQLGTFRPSVCVATFRFHLGLNKVHLKIIRIIIIMTIFKKLKFRSGNLSWLVFALLAAYFGKRTKQNKKNTYRSQPQAHVPWAYMCGMNKVCWLANHGAINPPSPFLKTTTKTTI